VNDSSEYTCNSVLLALYLAQPASHPHIPHNHWRDRGTGATVLPLNLSLPKKIFSESFFNAKFRALNPTFGRNLGAKLKFRAPVIGNLEICSSLSENCNFLPPNVFNPRRHWTQSDSTAIEIVPLSILQI